MNIDCFRQNKPSYIAKDFEACDVPFNKTMEILLFRGVFKWFAVRRDLIKAKLLWKTKVKSTLDEIVKAKKNKDKKLFWYRGYLKAMEECRKDIRAMCHSKRWRAPDFDRKANLFLRQSQSLAAPIKGRDDEKT